MQLQNVRYLSKDLLFYKLLPFKIIVD